MKPFNLEGFIPFCDNCNIIPIIGVLVLFGVGLFNVGY